MQIRSRRKGIDCIKGSGVSPRLRTEQEKNMSDQPKDEVLSPESAPNDSLAANRSIPVVAASMVPVPPKGYKVTAPDTKRKLLRLVGEEEEAEVKEALKALIKRGTKVTEDLGKNAPDVALLAPLLERLESTQETITATELFLTYLNEVEDIALSDALLHLEKVQKLYEANVDDEPQLKAHYAPVGRIFEARANAIREGLSRKRAEALNKTKTE
jgi:hypothetical protein